MRANLPRAAQRALALVILAALMAIAWLGIIHPIVVAHEEIRGTIDEARALLERYRRVSEASGAWQLELNRLRGAEATMPGLATGSNAALAAAELQNQLKQVVEVKGGEVKTTQSASAAVASGFERIEVRQDLTIPVSALADILYLAETHAPYLFVDALDIHVPETWPSDGQPGPKPQMSMRWTVHAYRWVGVK